MRKLIPIILTFLLSGSFVFASDTMPFQTIDSLKEKPLFGTRPWEQDLSADKKLYKQNISKECSLQEKLVKEKERKRLAEIKRKQEELRRKKEQEEKERSEQNRINKKWDYFERKDYGVTKKSSREDKVRALLEYAKDHIGAKYVYGGGSWYTGVDCSGFTMLCYRKLGVPMPHYSGAQVTFGKPVASISEAKAGDLIRYYGHIAIYLGDNKIIHASPPYVCIGNDATYSKIRCIRRIFY